MKGRIKSFLCFSLSAVGVVSIAFSVVLAINNFSESNKAKKQADEVLKQLSVSENIVIENNKSVKTVGEHSYIGILYIPVLQLYLPVMDTFEYSALKISPCCYSGSAETNDLVIAGHNYRSHFGMLNKLKAKDEVFFFTASGQKIKYHVENTEILSPGDVKPMIENDYDLSLFTCTLSGSKRLTVRCTIER